MSDIHPSRLRPTTVLSVRAPIGPLLVDHVGLVSRRCDQHGLPFIYNASKRSGKVKLEPWGVFTLGVGRASIHDDICGTLTVDQVLRRAHSRLGDPWDVWSANCEHYVRWCHGLDVKSPQVRVAVGVAVGAAAVLGALLAAAASER